MINSIFIAMSGLDAYSKGLRTISNNVANLNTSGFKSSSLQFSDLAGGGASGGVYAEYGYGSGGAGAGVRYGDPIVTFRQGEIRQTNGDLDVALQGTGFLVLLAKPGDKAGSVYTRTGQFKIADDGSIQERTSGRQLGLFASDTGVFAASVNGKRISPPKATTKITFSENLSSSATDHTISNIDVYDSLGTKTTLTVKFVSDFATAAGQWKVSVEDSNGNKLKDDVIKFAGNSPAPGSDKFQLDLTPAGADPQSITFDFSSGVTGFSSGTSSTLKAGTIDGRATGSLTTATVNSSGEFELSYSNGQKDVVGKVAIAEFEDVQALNQLGDATFENVSGREPSITTSGANGSGTIKAKSIEASNVDLSQEFGQLILVQRGFQASSQVISVTNEMIQQLFDLRSGR